MKGWSNEWIDIWYMKENKIFKKTRITRLFLLFEHFPWPPEILNHRKLTLLLNIPISILILFIIFPRMYIPQTHWVKSVHIRSYSGPYFPAFGLNNSEYRHFLRSDGWYDVKHSLSKMVNTGKCGNNGLHLFLKFDIKGFAGVIFKVSFQ